MESKKDFILSIIKTLLATLSVAYYCEINRNIIFLIVIFILIYVFFKTNKNSKNIYTMILSFISNVFILLGKYVVFLESNLGNRTIIIRSILCLIGGFILFKELYNYLFNLIDKKKINLKTKNDKPIYIFVSSFIIIFIVWLVVLLAEYPSPVMQDTLNQFEQIFGDVKYHNDHPFLHTMYIKTLYDIASIFCGTYNNKLFVMSLIQTIFHSLLYSYFSYFIYKKTGSILASILTTLFYAFISYNSVYNISISKDTSYTLVTCLLLISYIFVTSESKVINIVIFIICSILFCLIRKNGLYAYLVFFIIIFIIYISTKECKKLLIYCTVALLISIFIKNTIISNIISSKNANSVSINLTNFNEKNKQSNYDVYIPAEIPIQQVATVVHNKRKLTKSEIELIESRCPINIIDDVYDKYLVDPIAKAVREHTNYYSTKYSGFDYFKLWLDLFVKYPQDYIESFVYLTRYYFYPNRVVGTNIYYVADNSYGFIKESLFSEGYTYFVEKQLDFQKNIPIINIFYSPGIIMFFINFLLFYYLYRKQYNLVALLSIYIGIWITIILATPCADCFRYIYPIVGSFPLIACLPLLKTKT